jgi:hypothetical protein
VNKEGGVKSGAEQPFGEVLSGPDLPEVPPAYDGNPLTFFLEKTIICPFISSQAVNSKSLFISARGR